MIMYGDHVCFMIRWVILGDIELYQNHAMQSTEERSEFLKWYSYITCSCHLCIDKEQEEVMEYATKFSF